MKRRRFLQHCAATAGGIIVPGLVLPEIARPANVALHLSPQPGGGGAGSGNNLLTDLVAYWPMEGSSPTLDVHGTYALTANGGTITSDNSAPTGNGANFNVSTLGRFDNALDSSGGSFTVSVWARLDAFNIGNYGSWLVNRRSSTASNGDWQFYYLSTSNEIIFDYYYSGGLAQVVVSPRLSTGVWRHYVIGVNADTLEASLYIDGVSQGTASIPSLNSTVDNNQLTFGANGWGSVLSSLDWDGQIADGGYWIGRAPDQAMVNALYNSGSGLNYANFQ
jgi:hypothetical protein